MKLTLDQVRHVASLARLSLTPEEEQRYQHQLSAVLGAVDELATLDTDQVEPTSHATMAAEATRPDVVVPSLDPSQSLANAPAKVGTSFAVPKILE